MILAGAIQRGLTLDDFEKMTLGQIADYCITYNGTEVKGPQKATQKQIDQYLK